MLYEKLARFNYDHFTLSRLWQATKWLGVTSLHAGSSAVHCSLAYAQRVRNRHPDGGDTGLGKSPVSIIRFALRAILGSATGIADTKLRV